MKLHKDAYMLVFRCIFVYGDTTWCGRMDGTIGTGGLGINRKRRVIKDWKDMYRSGGPVRIEVPEWSWKGNDDEV